MLKFHPEPGALLVCDYGTEPIAPELRNRRPVVVVSPRMKRRSGLCTVVPLSAKKPKPAYDFHRRIRLAPPLPPPFDAPEMWVEAERLASVGFCRLHLPRTSRDDEGRREHLQMRVSDDDLRSILICILLSLGVQHLTPDEIAGDFD